MTITSAWQMFRELMGGRQFSDHDSVPLVVGVVGDNGTLAYVCDVEDIELRPNPRTGELSLVLHAKVPR